jgi:hypothetical protein
MKTFLPMMSLAAGTLFSGCATNHNGIALAPVGPARQPTASGAATGSLVVYSAYKRNADFNSRDNNRQEYSDYQILAADGHLLRKVHNNSGTVFQDVVSVNLPPGQYSVVARANGYGYLTVPVMVEVDHSTVLHLEGGDKWGDESLFNQTNSVRLPDGQIVGYRADAN